MRPRHSDGGFFMRYDNDNAFIDGDRRMAQKMTGAKMVVQALKVVNFLELKFHQVQALVIPKQMSI